MARSGGRASEGQQKITQKHIHADGDVIGYQEIHAPVTQVNVIHADGRLLADWSARSAYLEHVRALAPDSLEEREEELATLAGFCTSVATEGGYLWWWADAWSGKSALLSWFVLHPPPGAHVLSFFVTSSLPHQNNRHSFVENVIDQLHDMVDEPRPASLTDTMREAHFRKLLTTVADRVRQRGGHFTLVVDGLDEDRGVDGAADAHSIAALLPSTGVRVVVASRSLPDLPDDVPPDHPLRKSAVVKNLSPSPRAAAVRDTMIRDLKRLLSGTIVQQDLLGFISAAGGGLSTRDLAELTGTSEWQVEDDLRTTAGRSFTRRPGDPPVYVMAHAELLGLATEMLGPRLDSYRQRLHAWADTYRSRQWPSNTPRYLLDGYTATLTATADLPRLLTYVTDPRRQDLVSASTGHDDAALVEIKAAQGLLLRQNQPNLVALVRLAVHRTNLYLRNDWIPTNLPSSWVEVGEFDRAESLVAAIGDLVKRARALTSTAEALHHEGEQRRAAGLLDEAEDLANSFNQFWGAWPLAELAEAATRIGDHERARRAVNAIKHAHERAAACASLTLIAFGTDRHDEAERWYLEAEEALSEKDGLHDVTVLAWVAAAAGKLGFSSKAAAFVDRLLNDLPQGVDRWGYKAKAAEKLAASGLTDAACAVSATIIDVDFREDSLLGVTRAVARRDLDEAEELARSASDDRYLCARLAGVAFEVVRSGDQSRADRLLAEIEELRAEAPQDQWRWFSIVATAVAHGHMGAVERAESAVHRDILPSGRVNGALSVAAALVRWGDRERASRLIELAEERAQTESAGIDARRLLRWVGVMVDFREFERAEQLVQTFPSDEVRSAGMAIIAEGLLVDGAVEHAELALQSIADPRVQRRPRLELLRVLLAQGNDRRAVELARTAVTPQHRAESLTFVAGTTRRPDLLDEVVDIAEDVTDHKTHMTLLATALRTAANLGDRSRAKALWQRMQAAGTHTGQQTQDGGSLSLPRMPDRLRTLTEVVDTVDSWVRPRISHSEDPRVSAVSGAPPLWWPGKGLSRRVEVAYDLVTNHWFDRVEDLVKIESGAFEAIVSELDRLGSRASFRPRDHR
ncbi:hypothetical protein [Saccharopolyspora cebuensis]|uniref:Nephrocystin 3-like N-terminal domain-containing protein n=1 Tax=Saccharopolyspora cebuensis TaxID=418759 RepID=A0ABV4CMF2_9PSEU